MDFELSEEQRAIRAEVRRFAENEIAPVATEHDRAESYPREVVEKAADLGLTAPHVPIEYGGVGYSPVEVALLVEELFAVDPGIGLCIASAGFGSQALVAFGTDDQKERFLPPLTEGEAIMGAAISEPQAGSDVTAITTQAKEDGDEWVINGNKMWITNGSVGDYFVVMCETDPEVDDRYMGYSQIMIEADRDGFSSEKITGKMGIRASDTAELLFDGVRVPKENLVGSRGMGFPQLMQFFDETRTGVAAQGVGTAKGAAERALSYTQEREQFGRPVSEFQAIRHELAEMHTDIEAARQLTYESAWQVENGDGSELTKLASMAKEFASRVAVDVADRAVQLHGGAGFVDDHDVERLYRDAKITQIYEGTSQIQKNIIARELLDEGF